MSKDVFMVGRGVADVTGQPWGVGMMGYGMPHQRTNGILSRQYARAFLFVGADGSEVVYVVADIGMFFQAGVEAILAGLAQRYGARFTARNVVLTATHTHCGPGGHGHHLLYNVTTKGFHRQTFARLVDGVLTAIERAVADVAPTDLVLNRGSLADASANRAAEAFARDPAEERDQFPGAIDPATTLLRLEREGRLVGAINWFAVHNTSMTNRNRLISADNKGLAAYLWECDGAAPRTADAELVVAFAQTAAGDLSPNLDLEPGRGPTDDERENTRIIAERQLAAARGLAQVGGDGLEPRVDARMMYADLADQRTDGGRTGTAVLGASFAAGKLTDGPGSPLFREGKDNPVPQKITGGIYRLSRHLREVHAPKDLLIPLGAMRWAQRIYPIQAVRLGHLVLVCLPFEVTIVAGLRLRRAVAAELGIPVDHVVCQGYANGYGHYVTTPEEYDVQRYEGGSTIFGREELPALIALSARVAGALHRGEPLDQGATPPPHRLRLASPVARTVRSIRSTAAVRVLTAPETAAVGETVVVEVAADDPNIEIRPTYLLVERWQEAGHDATWVTEADDSAPSTTIAWSRERGRWTASITWVPAAPGRYRIRYLGREQAVSPEIRIS